MKPGEPFNPWRKVCGFYPPDIISRNRDLGLTDGQKRLYERAVRWAGKSGTFWHAFETMADALGKSVSQVKRDMAALEEKKLLGHKRRQRQSSVYHFLWHPVFEVSPAALQDHSFEVASTALQDDGFEVSDTNLEVSYSAKNGVLEVASTTRQLCNRENYVKESSSKKAPVRETATNGAATDDEFSSPRKQKTQWSEEQIRKAQDRLNGKRRDGAVPDRQITLKILEAFSASGDLADEAFLEWVEGPDIAHAEAQRKTPGWGLYLKDAQNRAEAIGRKIFAQQQEEERLWQLEQERQRPIDPATAIERAEQEMNGPKPGSRMMYYDPIKFPEALRKRILRGKQISVADVIEQVRKYRTCKACNDSGETGSAFDGSLGFCDCMAGEEKSHEDGADWPQREMERVNSTPKDRLIRATWECGDMFANMSLEQSAVEDDGQTLTITFPGRLALSGITEPKMQAALWRMDIQREIKIVESTGPRAA